jgi:hypothetical protein
VEVQLLVEDWVAGRYRSLDDPDEMKRELIRLPSALVTELPAHLSDFSTFQITLLGPPAEFILLRPSRL